MGSEPSQGWHTEDIKAALRKRHGTLTRLCRQWGLSPSAISTALLPYGRLWTVEQRIADALGVHPHTLWPERWHPDGTPVPPAERKTSRNRAPAHRPNAKAA